MQEDLPILSVIHPGSLGDVLLALEGIRSLKRHFPHHRLLWIGQAETGKFLMDCGEVDDVFSIDGQFFQQLFLSPGQWSERTKQIMSRCTHCVCWLHDHNGRLEENLTSFGVKDVLIESPKSFKLSSLHAEDRFLEILEPWGIRKIPCKEKLNISVDFQKSRQYGHDEAINISHHAQLIVIHPGSGSVHKCVDSSLLGRIARNLLEKPHTVFVILEGPTDEPYVQNLIHTIRPEHYHLFKDRSLSSVALLLRRATLYIGHDSGMTHLAAALGVPSIALFGPTDPAQWAPRRDNVSVIRGLPCQCTDWEEVRACHPKPCLNVSVDVVLQQAERLLDLKSSDLFFKQSDLDEAQKVSLA